MTDKIEKTFVPSFLNARTIFLADGFGALLTCILLAVVLPRSGDFFGMPVPVLHRLASIAAVLAIYSFSCFFRRPLQWPGYLRLIIIANCAYCLLSFGCIIYYYNQLKVPGLIYFSLELLLIVALVAIEINILKTNN